MPDVVCWGEVGRYETWCGALGRVGRSAAGLYSVSESLVCTTLSASAPARESSRFPFFLVFQKRAVDSTGRNTVLICIFVCQLRRPHAHRRAWYIYIYVYTHAASLEASHRLTPRPSSALYLPVFLRRCRHVAIACLVEKAHRALRALLVFLCEGGHHYFAWVAVSGWRGYGRSTTVHFPTDNNNYSHSNNCIHRHSHNPSHNPNHNDNHTNHFHNPRHNHSRDHSHSRNRHQR